MIIKINSKYPEIELIKKATQLLKDGNPIIFPTDTVYGLGANGLDPKAIRKLFEIKKREKTKPFALLVGERDAVYKYCKNISPLFFVLTERFWPGALTIVMDALAVVPKETLGTDSGVALRMPDSKVALALLKQAGVPIVASSANFSGGIDPAGVDDIEKSLMDMVTLVIDGGRCPGVPSTVVDLRNGVIKILREGMISAEEILAYRRF